jgi:superfamily II DNA or RNA helicase
VENTKSLTIEVFGNIYEQSFQFVDNFVSPVQKPQSEIQLRDYQQEAYEVCISDLRNHRSSLIVLATGLGKTILFSKIIQNWKGRVLVLVHLEELLQNAYQEIEAITGEIIGIERQKDRENGERVVVSLIHTLSRTYTRFPPNFFSLIIIDEAHHSASNIYGKIIEYFGSAKIIGLTATDARADGKSLPFSKCSYRMGIREGISQGYLVPIRGRRVIIDSINLTKVKQTSSGDFDEQALDDEMVKGASAIADVITNDYPFDKGILFFPGCASAKLTSELINKRISGTSVYIDGKITGRERRNLVNCLRKGESNWLCNVGIATEGFNWPEAAVIGMCAPTLSRAAYVQRAGRGTRPLASLLNGLQTDSERKSAINESTKPYMTILDFVGISANLNLISAESFLEPVENDEKSVKVDRERQESDSEEPEESKDESVRVDLGISRIASCIQSRTVHSVEEFDPFEASGQSQEWVQLKNTTVSTDTLSEKQYNLLKKFNICDDINLKKSDAQKIVQFIAGKKFRMSNADKEIARKIYRDIRNANINSLGNGNGDSE